MGNQLIKRKYHYIEHPTRFEIKCDRCNGQNIWWSEFEGRIWCYDCQIDTPGTGGIFDGPIPFNVLHLLGVSLDRINLETKKVEVPRLEDGRLMWEEA